MTRAAIRSGKSVSACWLMPIVVEPIKLTIRMASDSNDTRMFLLVIDYFYTLPRASRWSMDEWIVPFDDIAIFVGFFLF